jgi:hypothetical protein
LIISPTNKQTRVNSFGRSLGRWLLHRANRFDVAPIYTWQHRELTWRKAQLNPVLPLNALSFLVLGLDLFGGRVQGKCQHTTSQKALIY